MGIYVAFFLLYYLLADWHNLSDWVGRHLGVSDELGIEIANDSTSAVRTYFYALTLANIPVAASVGLDNVAAGFAAGNTGRDRHAHYVLYSHILGQSFLRYLPVWSLSVPAVFGKQ